MRFRDYPRSHVERRILRNKRRNPMRCNFEGCDQPSTCVRVTEVDIFRGNDVVEPRCEAHKRQ